MLLQVFPIVLHIDLAAKVVNQLHVIDGLLIGLNQLFADVVPLYKIVLMRLPRVVEIRVEVEELAPSQVQIVNVLVNLLAHVDEMLPGHRVVDHGRATSLFEALRGEESRLLTEIVHLLRGIGQHVAEGRLCIIQGVHSGAHLVGRAPPLRHVLPLEQPLLALVEVDTLRVVAGQGLSAEPVSFLVRFRLLAHVFEPGCQLLVHELPGADRMVPVPDDQVRKPAVEFVRLRDLRELHELAEVIDLGTDREVVIGELVGTRLQLFAPLCDVLSNLRILSLKLREVLAEFGSVASSLNLDLARDRLEFVDIARPNLVLNRQQLQVELVLVRLLQERHKEVAGFEDLGAKDGVEEPLIVVLTLDQLTACQLLLAFLRRERRNDNLRIHLEKVVSQDQKVAVEALNAPFHRECIHRDHHARLLRQAGELTRHILVDAGDQAYTSAVARQSVLLGHACHASSQHTV